MVVPVMLDLLANLALLVVKDRKVTKDLKDLTVPLDNLDLLVRPVIADFLVFLDLLVLLVLVVCEDPA